MADTSIKVGEMRTASIDEAADLLRTIAGNRRADESKKAVLRRIGRQLKDWSDNRVKDVWRRDRRIRIRAEEIEQLRKLAKQGLPETTKDELAELRSVVARLARYEPLLERIDAEFFSPEISAARDQAGEARRLLGKDGVRIRS
jgi:hypothetical protein